MNNYVLVIDTNKQPLKPTTPKRARLLLNKGKAAVFRRYPFTLILKHECKSVEPFLEIRIDPGSKKTGLALVNQKNECIWGMELEHRGQQIVVNYLSLFIIVMVMIIVLGVSCLFDRERGSRLGSISNRGVDNFLLGFAPI
ncbi:MAG: RRXRR domain-containing protein [Xenococcaceae cyanobacterium MO_188.B19]|nr:RRXRR domain-containing protein [Xenococcaceae cyanobacterium MO_188.B19]